MYAVLSLVGFMWIFILFFDTVFKTCLFHPYFRALRMTGLEIRPLVIYCRITRFNRMIYQMGRWCPSWQKFWFNVGAAITSLIVLPCIFLYAWTLIRMFFSSSAVEYNQLVLLPLIPGVNFPTSHWMIYIFICLTCSVIHEFGHALAASRERISLENCGFALCVLCPLAFVHFRMEQFALLSKWQKMRIFCAGIWHNIILALWAMLALVLFPVMFSPLFHIGSGVSVFHIHEQSGLNNPGGLVAGDQIFQVGNCSVKNFDTWQSCLDEFKEKSPGLCVPASALSKDLDLRNFQKCSISTGSIYFQTEELETARGICLHARDAIQGFAICDQTNNCGESSLCVFPQLSNNHRFVVIRRHEKPAVLYEGPIAELRADVSVSEYLPRWKMFPPDIAEYCRLFLEYILMFSSGLACLNVLPIFGLDGEFIIKNLIDICFVYYLTRDQRKFLLACIINTTWVVVISILLLTFRKLYVFYF